MVGQHIGHYRIVRKIGEGGVGHVYLAEDSRLERQVALKILSQANPTTEQLSRFEREAKAAAALNHPNIVAVYDYGHEDSIPYVVMELLAGHNLRDVLKNGALPFRAAVDIASEIVNGLAAAHDKGIAHRHEQAFAPEQAGKPQLVFLFALRTTAPIPPVTRG